MTTIAKDPDRSAIALAMALQSRCGLSENLAFTIVGTLDALTGIDYATDAASGIPTATVARVAEPGQSYSGRGRGSSLRKKFDKWKSSKDGQGLEVLLQAIAKFEDNFSEHGRLAQFPDLFRSLSPDGPLTVEMLALNGDDAADAREALRRVQFASILRQLSAELRGQK